MLYSIETDVCLGMSHCGSVNAEGSGYVDLSDEEVKILVDLIREKGTTDVEEMGLEELHPEIFEKLDDAYREVASDAEELHWLWESYESGYCEYDFDEVKEHCKDHCGFKFEYDAEKYLTYDELDEEAIEEDENEAFEEWLGDYLRGLPDAEAISFFYDHLGGEVELEEVDYEVGIPAAIIKLANGE